MKVNPIQYFFAYDILGKLCFFGFPIAAMFISFTVSEIDAGSLGTLTILGLSFFISVVSIALGFLSAVVFISAFLSPFYRAVERMNGGPFKPGDRVYVISGDQKGKITEVYSDWQGLAVRIVIGEVEKRNYKDVCLSFKLLRVEGTELGDGAEA
ncbi:MAG: KOW motif domain-containing protein [Pirellulales bacterium]